MYYQMNSHFSSSLPLSLELFVLNESVVATRDSDVVLVPIRQLAFILTSFYRSYPSLILIREEYNGHQTE